MPIQPKTVEQVIEEWTNETWGFDIEYPLEKIIRSVYARALRRAAEALPTDALVGNGDYCLTCEQHIAAGDCNCDGVNYGLGLARAAILAEADKAEKV